MTDIRANGNLAEMHVDGTTKMFCVFGDPIAHTFSPRIHEILIRAYGGNMAYTAHHVKPEHIGDAIRGAWAMEIAGINLTIPHKEISMPYLCGIDSAARKVGAVNFPILSQLPVSEIRFINCVPTGSSALVDDVELFVR